MMILTVAAILAPWWSLSSFWGSLTAIQWAAVVSAFVLTVGAVWEYWAKIKLLILLAGKWILRRWTPFDRCAFRKLLTHSIGPLLVVLGIAGEVVFEGRAFILEDKQEEQAKHSLGSLQEQAQNLKEQFDTVKQEADGIGKQEDAMDERLDAASGKLDNLEGDVLAQGPRWKLLKRDKLKLVKQLRPFAEQKIDVFVCGTHDSADGETISTWGQIARILGSDGAKWSSLHGGLSFWDTRPLGCEGIMVWVSSKAPDKTAEAARALNGALVNTLPPAIGEPFGIVNPDWTEFLIKQNAQPENAPWILPARNPDLITVLIGSHPQAEPGQGQKHK